eukprot:TRINITY_DN7562_c0_g1_i2.p1 TRINITY_DN7562_c0_g1~~TRINITY_DN7562_c0_g1_i2.p1  ORF type:complete len:310 (-),score=59.20 TRINITY_DN7562_c0_g1_i2:496-1425(-)
MPPKRPQTSAPSPGARLARRLSSGPTHESSLSRRIRRAGARRRPAVPQTATAQVFRSVGGSHAGAKGAPSELGLDKSKPGFMHDAVLAVGEAVKREAMPHPERNNTKLSGSSSQTAVVFGSLSEGDAAYNFALPAKLSDAPELKHVYSISSDDCRIFITTIEGGIHQWFMSKGKLAKCHQHLMVLQEDEQVLTVQSSAKQLYMLTDQGRILRLEQATYQPYIDMTSEETVSYIWEATTVDATPADLKARGKTARILASSFYSENAWVRAEEDSQIVPLKARKEIAPIKSAAMYISGPDEMILLSRKGEC